MARSERQEDGTRGGVGTLARTGARQRPPQAPETAPPAADPRRGRPGRPVPSPRPAADPRPAGEQRVTPGRRSSGQRGDAPQAVAAPPRPGLRRRAGAPPQPRPAEGGADAQRVRTTGPQPAVAPAPLVPERQPQPAQPGTASAPVSSHRMPFVLLLCGLLGGALVSALVISTTLAEGSFQISKLQSSTSSLAKQQQALEEQVAQAQAPQQIAQRAAQLGMRRVGELQFIDLKTGKTSNDGPTWSGAVNAPGYNP
jgi:hypothetical protein